MAETSSEMQGNHRFSSVSMRTRHRQLDNHRGQHGRPAASRGQLWLAAACCWLPWLGHHAAMTGYGWLTLAGRLALVAACFWPVVGCVSVPPVLCGPSVVVLASRLTVHSTEGCFGWLNRRGYAGT